MLVSPSWRVNPIWPVNHLVRRLPLRQTAVTWFCCWCAKDVGGIIIPFMRCCPCSSSLPWSRCLQILSLRNLLTSLNSNSKEHNWFFFLSIFFPDASYKHKHAFPDPCSSCLFLNPQPRGSSLPSCMLIVLAFLDPNSKGTDNTLLYPPPSNGCWDFFFLLCFPLLSLKL